MLIKGQFCVGNVKAGKYGVLDFDEDFTPQLDYIAELDNQFGSTNWDCFEVIAVEVTDGRYEYTGDYGYSDIILQFDREEA